MKDRFIADLMTNDDFIGFFMIKQIAIKTGSNRKAYLDLTLGDRTGEISLILKLDEGGADKIETILRSI